MEYNVEANDRVFRTIGEDNIHILGKIKCEMARIEKSKQKNNKKEVYDI
jgi:hypothetical protein